MESNERGPEAQPDTATRVVDSVTLRFQGKDEDGTDLNELRAAHVAEVLQGLVGLSSDFGKAGVFHNQGPEAAEVYVRPAEEGSFIIEVVRFIADNEEAIGAVVGAPSLSAVIWWATKSARAKPRDIAYLDNGNVKIQWQDDTVQEVPVAAWEELNKHANPRKKQLRKILAPLSDSRVNKLEITNQQEASTTEGDLPVGGAPATFTLERDAYDAVRPDEEIEWTETTFDTEAQVTAVDFEDRDRWRVKTTDRGARLARMDDEEFLGRIANGLAIRKSDIFQLQIYEEATTKNGRTQTAWTILKVLRHRRSVSDDDSRDQDSPSA